MTRPTADATLRIGELSAALGLNPKTIRYYEEIGLLPAAPRTESGYRLYATQDLERLRFIVKAKAIGLSLEEIGEILALQREGRTPCGHVLGLLDRKLAEVDQQLSALRDFRLELVGLREEGVRRAATDACVCGIIEGHEPAERAAAMWHPLTAGPRPRR